jgi:hypothetical protein
MTIDQITAIQQSIIEHNGYCEVSSASAAGKTYRVYVNSKFYSVSCNCRAGQHNQDCGHRVAVDRHFDSRRNQPVATSNSCILCGRETKQVVCGRCLGE